VGPASRLLGLSTFVVAVLPCDDDKADRPRCHEPSRHALQVCDHNDDGELTTPAEKKCAGEVEQCQALPAPDDERCLQRVRETYPRQP
jgi:hypothetical protein